MDSGNGKENNFNYPASFIAFCNSALFSVLTFFIINYTYNLTKFVKLIYVHNMTSSVVKLHVVEILAQWINIGTKIDPTYIKN